MKRFLPDNKSLQALLGLVVIVLQVLGALHFSLVRHGYSAASGGIVHVHSSSRAEHAPGSKLAASRVMTLAAEVPSCGTELCQAANAPQGSAPRVELLAAGMVAFGEVKLLCEPSVCSRESRRVFSSAPKTSPPG